MNLRRSAFFYGVISEDSVKFIKGVFDGSPCAVKAACTVKARIESCRKLQKKTGIANQKKWTGMISQVQQMYLRCMKEM